MLYQLPNGRTIQMSIETYLSLSDDEFRELTGLGYGKEINNPLFNSSINDGEEEIIEDLYLLENDNSDINDLLSKEQPPMLDLED